MSNSNWFGISFVCAAMVNATIEKVSMNRPMCSCLVQWKFCKVSLLLNWCLRQCLSKTSFSFQYKYRCTHECVYICIYVCLVIFKSNMHLGSIFFHALIILEPKNKPYSIDNASILQVYVLLDCKSIKPSNYVCMKFKPKVKVKSIGTSLAAYTRP